MKNKCPRCTKKIRNNYTFCPTCGFKLKSSKETKKEWGMIGENDYMEEGEFTPLNKISGGFLNKILGGVLKMLEKEIQKDMEKQNSEKAKKAKNQEVNPFSNVKLMINGKEFSPVINQDNPMENKEQKDKSPKKTLPINFSSENLRKFKKMDKKEPKTQIRRMGDKITYELNIPGVNSIKDISIIKINDGFEIKALGKKKAYKKTIAVDLPLLKYMLLKEKLFLEMDAEE